MNRLRLGHTHATLLYRINRTEEPICELCGEILTVSHFIFKCSHTQHQRRDLDKTWNLALGYNADLTPLLKFIKDANLFNMI